MSLPDSPQLVYLIFAREVGPIVKVKYPHIEKVVFNKILGKIWNVMPHYEKDIYYQKAKIEKLCVLQTELRNQEEFGSKVSIEPVTQNCDKTENFLLREEETRKLSFGNSRKVSKAVINDVDEDKSDEHKTLIKEEPGNETIKIEEAPFIGKPEHIGRIDTKILLNELDAPTNIYTVELEAVDYEDNGEHTDKEKESKLVSSVVGRDHTSDFLNFSQEKIHDKQDRKFPCKECGKIFKTLSNLTVHKRIHSGQRPFLCSFCEKGFIQKAHMEKHILTHTGEKPWPCIWPGCDKSFTCSSNLNTHVKIHEGKKDFVCEICTLAFTQAVHLKQHMPLHYSERPFVCRACGLSYNSISALTLHKKIKSCGQLKT